MKKSERETGAVVVGRRLAKAREALEISQVELARRLGTSAGNLSNWENGYAMLPAKYIPKLFLITRIDSNYLFQGDMSGLPSRLHDKLRVAETPVKRGKRAEA